MVVHRERVDRISERLRERCRVCDAGQALDVVPDAFRELVCSRRSLLVSPKVMKTRQREDMTAKFGKPVSGQEVLSPM